MRKVLFFIILFLMTSFLKAQTVENIRAEQNGNKINVLYQIVNSNSKQTFKVSISAKVADDKMIDLKSISGDVGDNVKGGKDQYKAEWEVLKDVDKLTSAEFFVKIELKADESVVKQEKVKEEKVKEEKAKEVDKPVVPANNDKGRYFAALEFIGAKAGYRGKWGYALIGGLNWDGSFTLMGDVSKSIIRNQNFQWDIYPLLGLYNSNSQIGIQRDVYDDFGNYLYTTTDYTTSSELAFAFGLGTDISYKHIFFNIDVIMGINNTSGMLGLGWRF